MVVFLRKLQQEIIVGGIHGITGQLKVTVLAIGDGRVSLGVEVAAEDPPPCDRKHPQIRALAATLWRYRSALRSYADSNRGQAAVIVPELQSEGRAL